MNHVSKFGIEYEAGYIAGKQKINKSGHLLPVHFLWDAIGNLTSDLEPHSHTWRWKSV